MNQKFIKQIQNKYKNIKKSCKVVEHKSNELCLSVSGLEKQSPLCCGHSMVILFLGSDHSMPLCYVCSSCFNKKPLTLDKIRVPVKMRSLVNEL